VLEREFGARPELIRGAGGVFDVTVDQRMVYSKHTTGRFPDPAEVVAAIRALG
jgi:selT/selW/selH-like putative selenoprotein